MDQVQADVLELPRDLLLQERDTDGTCADSLRRRSRGRRRRRSCRAGRRGAERCCSNTGRRVPPETRAPGCTKSKGNSTVRGRAWVEKGETGTGEQGLLEKSQREITKKNSVEKAKTSPSAPLKMSQVSPRVAHPLGEEEADLAVSPPPTILEDVRETLTGACSASHPTHTHLHPP